MKTAITTKLLFIAACAINRRCNGCNGLFLLKLKRVQHATRLMTREIISAALQDQVFAAQFLDFAQCGAVSVHHLLSIIISGRKINTTTSKLTHNFNWRCLHELVLRTQETVEQNPENAERIAYDAGLTCD